MWRAGGGGGSNGDMVLRLFEDTVRPNTLILVMFVVFFQVGDVSFLGRSCATLVQMLVVLSKLWRRGDCDVSMFLTLSTPPSSSSFVGLCRDLSRATSINCSSWSSSVKTQRNAFQTIPLIYPTADRPIPSVINSNCPPSCCCSMAVRPCHPPRCV